MINNLYLNIGAMKAGTTWLFAQLRFHPELSFTPEKEIHYFASVETEFDYLSHESRIRKLHANVEGKDYLRIEETLKGVVWYADYALPRQVSDAWYQDLFKYEQKKYCADFCNLNSLLGDSGWRRVRQNFNQSLRVTYCLRDPFNRAWSHYKFDMEFNGRGADILSSGLDNFKEFLNQPSVLRIVEYHKEIEILKRNLLDEELRILYFEDFRDAPQASLDSLCEFLDIEKIQKSDEELFEKINLSSDLQMPQEWSDYLWSYLEHVYVALDELQLIHPSWRRKEHELQCLISASG